MDYQKTARDVAELIGSAQNIDGATHCVTRLRLILKDSTAYDRKALEKIEGVKGVMFNSGQLQIIFGAGTVNKVYDEFIRLTGAKEVTVADAKKHAVSKMGKLQQGFKVFSDIFIPIIPAFVAAAIIIGIKSLLLADGLFGITGSLADKSVLLANMADFFGIIATTFDYLPILVMYSAVKRFGGNSVLGILVGIVMVHPELLNRNVFALTPEKADYWNFLGLSVPRVAFQGGVFPAILTAWFMSKVEKIAQKYVPEVVSFVLVPTITILLANIALFTVFGPVGNVIGSVLAGIIDVLYNRLGALGAFVFAAMLQPLVVTGTHQAIWSVSIIAQGGGAIGMYLLAKKKSKDRDIAMSSFVPTLVGISEPAIFAVNMKYSIIPFICSCLGAGMGGAFMKLMSVRAIGQGLTGVLGMLIVVPDKLLMYVIGNLIAFVVPIGLILLYDKSKGVPREEQEEENEETEEEVPAFAQNSAEAEVHAVFAVTDGTVIPVEEVNDGVFSEKILGDGIGIRPEGETVKAPADGEICTVMEGTNHAVGIRLANGFVFLIHVGIETVSMNGDGFTCYVKVGDQVKKGQRLLTFDKKKIEKNGLDPTVIVVATEEGTPMPIKFKTGQKVSAGTDVIGEW